MTENEKIKTIALLMKIIVGLDKESEDYQILWKLVKVLLRVMP